MKRRSRMASIVAIGALLSGVGVGISWGSVSAAPTKTVPTTTTTVHSDTFAPFSRYGDGDSLEHMRYYSPSSGYGPGAAPNFFGYRAGSGHDAFFNSPDLALGAKPMSAVSAEVCLKVTDESDPADGDVPQVYVLVGVQDGARNYVLAKDAQGDAQPAVVAGSATCVTMTFDHPVKLVNGPHLVAVLDMQLRAGMYAEVEGVTYTLQPTAGGDVAPVAQANPAMPDTFLPSR